MFSGQTVLIVDDDPSQVLILSGYFQSQRAGAVIEANSAVDALERLRHSDSTVDLIVSDLMMPDMDGIEMLRELKKADYQGKLALVSRVKSEMCWIICLDAAPPRWVSRGRFVPRILRSVRL